MTDIVRDVSLLVSIAKIEGAVHENAAELERIPGQVRKLAKKIAEFDEAEAKAVGRLDAMKKERRDLEHGLQDAEAAITRYRSQLHSLKSNREYSAMLKEIETKETEIGEKEERVLELMEELEEHAAKHESVIADIGVHRDEARDEKKALEDRQAELTAECAKLNAEKPKLLSEVSPAVGKRYQRVHDKHGDLAVTRTYDGHCGGCGTQLPPQVVVEVKKNNQLITCQSCGRILVDYP